MNKYIQMGAYETQDAKAFVRDLLTNLIEPARRDARAAELDLASRHPGFEPDVYPFTNRSSPNSAATSASSRKSASPPRSSPS